VWAVLYPAAGRVRWRGARAVRARMPALNCVLRAVVVMLLIMILYYTFNKLSFNGFGRIVTYVKNLYMYIFFS